MHHRKKTVLALSFVKNSTQPHFIVFIFENLICTLRKWKLLWLIWVWITLWTAYLELLVNKEMSNGAKHFVISRKRKYKWAKNTLSISNHPVFWNRLLLTCSSRHILRKIGEKAGGESSFQRKWQNQMAKMTFVMKYGRFGKYFYWFQWRFNHVTKTVQ